MPRKLSVLCVLALLATAAFAQSNLTLPPSGDNQKASVTQYIGPVRLTIDYSSPDVHSPTGEDRRGKIWGDLVPYGFIDEAFGTCTQCPWRAGANENTVFTTSHDVTVQGQPLKAGSYGLFLAPSKDDDWQLIFSNNSTSWGAYTYDPAEDALRVKVKPARSEFHEWLTYEFTDRKPDQATAALKWEEIQVPFTIAVPNITDVYLSQIGNELRNFQGINWQNWNAAAQYAIQNKRPEVAVVWAKNATGQGLQFIGQENFQTLSTLSQAQELAGLTADAAKTRDLAMNHPTATVMQLHAYGRQLLNQGKKDDALKVWQANAKRYGETWPVNVGLARGYSAVGDYKKALKHAQAAVKQAPDDQNRKSLEAAVVKLAAGKDMN